MKMRSLILCSLLLFTGCTKGPVAWWKSVNDKAAHLASLEARHEVLVKEHEKLQQAYFRLEAELGEQKSADANRDLAKLNLEATGSVSGRGPASLAYKIPPGLSPEELQALAYEHLREKRFAEAAVSFDSLLTQPEAAALHDASSMYSAGVAWFQLGNFKKAQEKFDAAKANAAGEQRDKIRKKVDLWMRVIDRKVASEGATPEVDHTPLVNKEPAEHSRAPASTHAHEALPVPEEAAAHAAPAHHAPAHAPTNSHHETPAATEGHGNEHGH